MVATKSKNDNIKVQIVSTTFKPKLCKSSFTWLLVSRACRPISNTQFHLESQPLGGSFTLGPYQMRSIGFTLPFDKHN